MTNFEVMVEKAVSECKPVVLMGDFNVNLLKTSSLVEHLLSITGSNNLTQPNQLVLQTSLNHSLMLSSRLILQFFTPLVHFQLLEAIT